MQLHLVLMKWLGRIVALALTVVVTVVFGIAIDARKLPDLKLWHRVMLDAEFTTDQAGEIVSLEDYLEVERKLFKQLRERAIVEIKL